MGIKTEPASNMWTIEFCKSTKVWYIHREEFLHSDGQVRPLAIDSQGEPTGYYPSKKAAQAAIETWNRKN